MTTLQRGMFGTDYRVAADCADCGCMVLGGTEYEGDTLCAECFDARDLVVCVNCSKIIDANDSHKTPDDDDWCEDCYDAVYTCCEHCDDPVARDDTVTVRVGSAYRNSEEGWCKSCADNHATRCDDCCEYVNNDDSYCTAGGSDICESCYYDHYFTCEGCGEVYHNDDYYGNDDGSYCEDCRPCQGDYEPNGFRNRSGSLTELGSARCYGIELETDDCEDYYELENHAAWGAKDDPTVCGKEFFSDILEGDDGLQAIRDWARLASCNGWRAGSNAGYHLHIDLRGESDDSMYAVAYAYRATQELWWGFVESRRRGTTYAMSLRYSRYGITQAAASMPYYEWVNQWDRYNWANVSAYSRHKTIEIRLHQGTCNGDEVINWVKAHTRFVDWAATKGLAGVQEALDGKSNAEIMEIIGCKAWQDVELFEYYARKAASYR
jgi:hypothetical protein